VSGGNELEKDEARQQEEGVEEEAEAQIAAHVASTVLVREGNAQEGLADEQHAKGDIESDCARVQGGKEETEKAGADCECVEESQQLWLVFRG